MIKLKSLLFESRKHGFDLTDFKNKGYQVVLKNLDIPPVSKKGSYGWVWKGKDISITTGNNPITGEPLPATTLYYNIFSHNWFEIPEILNLVKDYFIKLIFRVNTRPKFKISESNLKRCQDLYEKNKNSLSEFTMSH